MQIQMTADNNKPYRPHIPMALTMLVLAGLFIVGCGDDDDNNSMTDAGTNTSTDTGTGTNTSTDTGTDTNPKIAALTSATPGGIGMLTETHSGWKQGPCLSCHENEHLGGFPVSACSHCHGSNGAPFRPEGHVDNSCSESDCHENQHAPIALSPPNDCRSCHTYASTAPCTHTEDYDIVVIGAGGGGLSAATKLAIEGENVLLVEQHYKPGGCMVTFDRGDYTFEASLHAIDGNSVNTLSALDIEDDVTLLSAEIMYRAVFPDFTIDVPEDIDEYRAMLKEMFPHQVEGIDAFFDIASTMKSAVLDGMTMAEALDSVGITDEKLIALLTELSGFLAGGPENLPAGLFIAMIWGYHVTGYAYVEGGSQAISDALAAKFQSVGGTLKLHSRATKIVIEGGLATQVQTDNGGCYNAGHVISNANLPDTYLKMVGEEHLPADVVQEVKTEKPAGTFATLFLGVDHDYTDLFPSGAHEIFIGTSYNTDFDYNVERCDEEGVGFGISNYSTLDSTNAPPGKNAIAITIPLAWECNEEWQWNKSYDDYNAYKAELAEIYIERTEAFLPDLSAHVEVMEMSTPRTIAAYTLNPEGTWAGFGVRPGKTGMEFMSPEAHMTPIPNLLIAGAWVGVAGQSVVLNSGVRAARLILEAE